MASTFPLRMAFLSFRFFLSPVQVPEAIRGFLEVHLREHTYAYHTT